jgi:hypothetical protein
MTLRKISAMGRGLTGGGLLLVVAGLAFQIGWAKIVGLVIAAAGLVLLWTKLRCPRCGGRIQDLKAERCVNCGEEMDYDAKI